jgi:ABC-type phosphonate transport system ATPase subunit
MNDPLTPTQDLKAYVAAAAALQSLELDGNRLDAVTRQFALLAGMAQRLRQVPLRLDRAPAPVYRP